MKKENKKNKKFIEPVVGKSYVKIIEYSKFKGMQYIAEKFYKKICNI